MKINIVGAGYVGLVTGLVLANVGHEVKVFDDDKEKVTSKTFADFFTIFRLRRRNVSNILICSDQNGARIRDPRVPHMFLISRWSFCASMAAGRCFQTISMLGHPGFTNFRNA